MPMNSLDSLMKMFPYFFDKKETSNFYKSQSVTNNQFKNIYQSIFDIVESFRLSKRCLIWREQSEPYNYVIHFVANFPNLKCVRLYKNDTPVYSEYYSYEDNVDSFSYSHNDTSLNETISDGSSGIIPQSTFKIIVETYEEYTLIKGYPENDEPQGNEYDHDESLDEIGAFHNIPRKEYLIVGEELYSATEPPYNNKTTEDDYYYMKRIINYLLKIHTTPLPILELWKLFGIDATMENREKLLLKVFDLERHPNFIDPNAPGDGWFSGTKNPDGSITEWSPKAWEHLDKFCDATDNLGKYFFVKASTKIPAKNQNVVLYFKFCNSLAKDLDDECTVDIYLDNKVIYSNIHESQKTLYSADIPQDKDNTFVIIGKDSKGEVIGSQEIVISVRGCNKGDFYVNPSTGSDSRDGKTRNTAFKTIQKAVDSVNGDKNLIILLSGDYEITNPVHVTKDCTIMGCGSILIENLTEDMFFTLTSDTTLVLQDLTLQYKGDICDVTDTTFTNNNGDGSLAKILILFTNAPVIAITKLELNFVNRIYCVGDTVGFTGTLKDKYGTALTSETVSVSNGETYTTNSSGAYTGEVIADKIGNLTLNASYSGDNSHKPSTATATIAINLRLRDFLSSYDYVIMDLQYVDDEWKYIKKPVNEITKISDLDGAILNLTYTSDMEVTFNRFHSYSNNNYLSKTDMTKLRGLLVAIQYDDYTVEYINAHVFGESQLTLTTPETTYGVGETISFTGTLLDKYDDPIPNKRIVVNNVACTTNSSGEYNGSLTATNQGTLILTARFDGDADYEQSTASETLTILISLAEILEDYDYVVTDMTYDSENRTWEYTTIPVSEISYLSDLNNCIRNLNKFEDNIQFERYISTEDVEFLTRTQQEGLIGLLVGIIYDDYKVKYTQIQ